MSPKLDFDTCKGNLTPRNAGIPLLTKAQKENTDEVIHGQYQDPFSHLLTQTSVSPALQFISKKIMVPKSPF